MKRWSIFFIIIIIILILFTLPRIRKNDEKNNDEISNINILISLNNDNGNKQIFDDYITSYNSIDPKIQVTPFFVQSDVEAILKLIYVKEANQKYDIACLGSNQIYSLIELGLIQPLDSYIEKSNGINWLEQMLPISMANSNSDGKLWSIPIMRNSRVVLFNQNLVKYQKESITFKELLLLSEERHAKTRKTTLLVPLSEVLIDYISYNSLLDSIALNSKGKYLNILEEDKINILEIAQRGVQNKSIENYTENAMKGIEEFLNGNICSLISNTYYANKILKLTDFPISYIPLMIDEDTTFPLQGSNLYLIKQFNTSEYTNSWNALLKFWEIASKDEQFIDKGNIPIIISQKEKYIKYENTDNPSYLNAIKTTYNGYSGMAINQNTKINLLLENMLRNILSKGYEVDKGLEEIQKKIDSILSD